MPSVTIAGTEYDATPLTPAQLLNYQCSLARLSERFFWFDLAENIRDLPGHLQCTVVSQAKPPRTLDRLAYWRVATRRESVQELVNMTCRPSCPEVTDNNAAEIFLALAPLILDRPVTLSGGEALAKLREGDDAQRDG